MNNMQTSNKHESKENQIINQYKKELRNELCKLRDSYKDRGESNQYKKRKTPYGMVLSLSGIMISTGTGIGSVVPGLGNAVGASSGVFLSVIIATSIKLHILRENKKINNAKKVHDAFDGMSDDNIDELVKRIIEDRQKNLESYFSNHQDNKNNASKYLARQAMSAIKENFNTRNKDKDKYKDISNEMQKSLSWSAKRYSLFHSSLKKIDLVDNHTEINQPVIKLG